MGGPRILHSPELEASFRRDWLDGVPRWELARKYGWAHETNVGEAAKRLGLPPRTGREDRVLYSRELVAAFRRDWELPMPLDEMAAMYGFRSTQSVSRAAQRLGLEKRAGGPPKGSTKVILGGGRWETRGLTQIWVEEDDDAEAEQRRGA